MAGIDRAPDRVPGVWDRYLFKQAEEAVDQAEKLLGPNPDPIGLAFARLKRLLRSDGHRTVPALTRFLGSATRLFAATECGNYIRHCGCGPADATVTPN